MRRFLPAGWRTAVLTLIVATLAVVGYGAVASGLMDELMRSRAWIKQPDFTETSRANEELFDQAVKSGVIWLDEKGPVVRAQPCEALHDPSLAVSRPGVTFSRPILDRLCNLPAGRRILSEMLAWNSSFLIAAARDDSVSSARCLDGKVNDLAVIPAGCRPAAWAARIVQGAGFAAPLSRLADAVPPPRDFAEFATRRARDLSDWAMFGPLRDGDERVALTGRLPSGNRRVTIDLILEPAAVLVGTQRVQVDPRRDEQTLRVGGLTVAASRVCGEEEEIETCAEAAQRGFPHGWRFVVTGARRGETELTVEGVPVRAVPIQALEIIGSGKDKRDGRARLWRSAHIEAECTRSKESLTCELGWRGTITQQRRGGGGRKLLFADGSPALDAAGLPTPTVDALGLTALIGYGPGDIGSLASAMGRARTREPLTLTVEPKIQKLVHDAIVEHMVDRLGRGKRPRKPGPLPQPSDNEPPDQGDGRAAVVILDAGDDPGAILAMSSWPPFEPGMHSWDVQALSAGRDGDSPLAGHAWRAGDVHTMPGSTFKLVTGIAGIIASKQQPAIGDIVLGRMAPARQAQIMGVGGGGLSVDGVPISNYGGAGFGASVLPPGPGGTGCPVYSRGAQISVCEALTKSSNLWFAGLALTMDGSKVGRPATAAARTGTVLAAATEHLFPIVLPAADAAARKVQQESLDLTRGIVPGALRLTAEPIELAVEDRRNARRIDLATNSYGQGVRASPLAMATVYGSVGARRVIRPRLLKPVGDVQETPAAHEGEPVIPNMSQAEAAPWLEAVDAGLHAVVNTSYGTAGGVMSVLPPAVRDRIFAKTGTADTTDGMNSAWLAGWMNDVAGRRRIAFACWVSHTRLTGGRACGAMMAPLLGKIASEGARK